MSVGEEHTNQMQTKCKIWRRKEWKDVDSKQYVMIELGVGIWAGHVGHYQSFDF